MPQDDENPFGDAELELTYPCPWTYTVIAETEEAARSAARGAVGALEHTFSFSRKSSGGRYLSFQLEVVVTSDNERLAVFRALQAHVDVRYVL